MEQHPIPQQISSYEFRLVGDMTLRQFGKVGGGAVLAILVYSTGLPGFFKWPLIFAFGGGGAALAFVPFQDRPLESWMKAFFKSIYSPTLYLWQKSQRNDWLKPIEADPDEKEDEEEVETKKKNRNLDDFLKSLPKEEEVNKKRREGLSSLSELEDKLKLRKEKQEKEKKKVKTESEALEEGEEEEMAMSEEKVQESWAPKGKGERGEGKEDWYKDMAAKMGGKQEARKTVDPIFGQIPMPKTPDVPNVIAGMVVDQGGKIVEGAIVEVQDEKGAPMRALRTNSLGQFQAATPMGSGEYLILVEKEGMSFAIMKIELRGEIVPPIKIQATIAS